ncbi:hypothetical protein FB45DRAFT_903402 [Roridomyces roridus]|uniref:ubiquitinyl hydrolase 1 n=1 Tax=Roridomyces roridus TaxID=1738132 RepID=A0AAD7C4B3_9AGAR|nr:hypothetical protein FB45DRAFT_903402 [Roridomyces roridus]
MAKGKAPSPQELYRARKQREEEERLAFLPPGLFNHGNTCFMNSVLQGLLATRLLSQLVHFAPIPPSTQAHSATLLASRRSPQLTNGHDIAGPSEQKWVGTMPIGDMFLDVLLRAWDAQHHRRRENLSPRPILTALGKKYDQYLDFAQQDAHEFMRILLDAISMEELDIIKKSRPPQPPRKRRRTSTPAAPPPPEDAPMSLVDMIFGGKLASILVCQKCKHVSHTYEDFNDLSLSIKHEDYGSGRKRERFKSFAKKLGTVVSLGTEALQSPRASSVPPTPRERPDDPMEPPTVEEDPRRRSLDIPHADVHAEQGQEIPVRLNGVSIVTTPDNKHIEFVDQPKVERKDERNKAADGWAKLGRRLSMRLGSSKKDKERRSRSKERASHDFSVHPPERPPSSIEIKLQPAAELETPHPSVPSITIAAPRPLLSTATPVVARSKSPKPPKPSAGETAYLRQILADVSGGSDALWLKLGGGLPGVEECLRMFTAVEVLDGENMVGCRRCWKIANGEYVPRTRVPNEKAGEDNDDSEDSGDNQESPVVPIVNGARPLIPTSISTPVIPVYSGSTSSLPLVTPQSSSSDSALGRSHFEDETDNTTPPSSASSMHSLPISGEQEAETSPVAELTVVPPTPSDDTFGAARGGEHPTLNPITEGVEMSHKDAAVNGLHPPNASHHYRHHSWDESTDGSSGDESDMSSGHVSSASPSDGELAAPRTKPKSKPKPVIMRPAFKRYLIAVPPPVLVIHLKRFQQVSKTMISFSNGFKKLDDYVTFPEMLDVTPFLAPKKEDYGLRGNGRTGGAKRKETERCMYRLYAVVVHIGNMGHYVAFVALPTAQDYCNHSQGRRHPDAEHQQAPRQNLQRRSGSGRTSVTRLVRLCTLEEVLKAKAYICMYERV